VINFCRFGYVIILGTYLLMMWLSLCGAREVDLMRYPSCPFSSLCTCSKPGPDLGIVRCQNVHLSRIPEPDETFLGLERSLWELDLSHNQLTRVPNRALRYLRKLRRLDLKGDALSACGTFNCAF
jgi:Leucine-rich repeat (LRR) protein